MSSIQSTNPNLPQNVNVGQEKAIAAAGPGVMTGPAMAAGTSQIPLQEHAQPERAIGEARVDKAFLETIRPDTTNVEGYMEQISQAEQEKARIQAQAQQALAEAARLMAEAQERERAAQMAAQRARDELTRTQAEVTAAAMDASRLKAAEASKARAVAELEAREAARKKAEQEAALQAARLAAAEEAEAAAARNVAEAKQMQARRNKEMLLTRAQEAQVESAAATQRAATATAAAEARSREAALATGEVERITSSLEQTLANLSTPSSATTAGMAGVAVAGPMVATAGTPQTTLSGMGMTQSPSASGLSGTPKQLPGLVPRTAATPMQGMQGTSMTNQECECWCPNTVAGAGVGGQSKYLSSCGQAGTLETMAFSQQNERDIRQLLHLHFTGMDFTSSRKLFDTSIENYLMLRVILGGVEARSQPLLWPKDGRIDPTLWHLDTTLPVMRPDDLLHIELYRLVPGETTTGQTASETRLPGVTPGVPIAESSGSGVATTTPAGATGTTGSGISGLTNQPAAVVDRDVETGSIAGRAPVKGQSNVAVHRGATDTTTHTGGGIAGRFKSIFYRPWSSGAGIQKGTTLLGKVAVRITTLVDGHISRDNLLRFDNDCGVILKTSMHLTPYRGTAGAGMQQQATPLGAGQVGGSKLGQNWRWNRNAYDGSIAGSTAGADSGYWLFNRY